MLSFKFIFSINKDGVAINRLRRTKVLGRYDMTRPTAWNILRTREVLTP